MTNAPIAHRKLATLLEHVARLQRRYPESAQLLKTNEDLSDAISMSVLVCAQEAAALATC